MLIQKNAHYAQAVLSIFSKAMTDGRTFAGRAISCQH
jgi:hypothetical protein